MSAKLTAKELIAIYQGCLKKDEFIEKTIDVNGVDETSIDLAYHLINECFGILEIPEKVYECAESKLGLPKLG